MLKDGTSARELFLMGKVAPDAWQVNTVIDGVVDYGDLFSHKEALVEFIKLATKDEHVYSNIYIVPVWNCTWHDEIQP